MHPLLLHALRSVRRPTLLVLGFGAGLGLAGCQNLTEVEAPDVVQPGDYNTAAGAAALAAGAVTQFNLAFGGTAASTNSGANQVIHSGEMADELLGTSVSFSSGWDSRDPQDPAPELGGTGATYTRLHLARVNLLQAAATLQRVAPDSGARIGQLFALVGYTEVFFGENFCAGVPLSRFDAALRPIYGQPLTSQQMYEQAIADFDSALAYGVDSARIANLARVGRGRALLNLGRFTEAAAAVASVPTTYVYHANYVTGVLHNGFYADGSQDILTVPEQEGTNGIDWQTANDPRVPLVNRSPALKGRDGTDLWAFAPYMASDAPVRLAGGVEARLIEAEAALQAGDASTWLNQLNELRATAITPAMAALSDPGTPAARVDLHFRERAFWLFLTGHRHGDLRRLVRQYGRNAETVFPTGLWREGLNYGTATNMALPAGETPNPNYAGCLDRDA